MKEKVSPQSILNEIIDIHTHCGGIDSSKLMHLSYPTCQNILDLDHKRKSAGVGFMVTFPMPNTLYFNTAHYWNTRQFIPSGFCACPFEYENELILREIAHFDLDHILPFMSFSLQDKVTKQQEHIYALAGSYPVYGLKYHTVTDQKSAISIETESDFLSLAEEMDIPILVHSDATGVGDSAKLLELASRHPNIRFCASHFGGFSRKLFDALRDYPYNNFFIDTAPVSVLCRMRKGKMNVNCMDLPFDRPDYVFRFYMDHLADRMIWGTDEPWTIVSNLDNLTHISPAQFGYQQEVNLLKRSDSANIVTRNAVKFLYGFIPEESTK